ncbi:MAG TPA: cupin domain-containing protein [Candidatus Acidoferrales bacterium]|nr:cupin domain-containing protein [Candidatus Acidoferrales bacterium]
MKRLSGAFFALVALILLGTTNQATPASPRSLAQAAGGDVAAHYMSAKFEDLKWEKILPAFGDDSPEIAILRVDPKTQATQLLIRNPKKIHITRHWHSANETHTILRGNLVFECGGKREELGPGSFNYIPQKMIHQAWLPDDGLAFITVDGAWDVNWVDGPPQPPAKK